MARAIDATEPAGGERTAKARQAAFGRAERHSRRVRRLKIVVPIVALAIAAGFAVWSFSSLIGLPGVSADGAAFSEGKLVMANPKMEGYTKDGQPYLITAGRAVQNMTGEGAIDLEEIDARIPTESGGWIKVEADTGVYDNAAGTVDLAGGILVTTDDGLDAKLSTAALDMSAGAMHSADPVDISMGRMHIVADSMNIQDKGKVLTFDRRVRVEISPSMVAAADGAGGGSNASN